MKEMKDMKEHLGNAVSIAKSSLMLICFVWIVLSILSSRDASVYNMLFTKSATGIFFLVVLVAAAIILAGLHKWDVFVPVLFLLLLYIGIVWTSIPASYLITDLYICIIPVTVLFLLAFLKN